MPDGKGQCSIMERNNYEAEKSKRVPNKHRDRAKDKAEDEAKDNGRKYVGWEVGEKGCTNRWLETRE